MVAARSLVAGLLIAAGFGTQAGVAGEIISAGTGSQAFFERRSADTENAPPKFVGNFVMAGSRGNLAPAPVGYSSNSVAQPPIGLFAAARQATVDSVPTPSLTFTPTYAPAPLPAPVAPTTSYDAFVNFGTTSYGDAGPLASGTPQPWYLSDSVTKAYGHTPTAQEAQDFSATVLARVASTFANSGLTIRATDDPSAPAAHRLSVTSGVWATANPNAAGITSLGHDGLSFIDKLAYAKSPDELEWAVAHNVAHELMHAFGGTHHMTPDGTNLDAPVADWSTLIDPNTRFSAESVSEMSGHLHDGSAAGGSLAAQELAHPPGCTCPLCQGLRLDVAPVPEPATMILWGSLAGIAGIVRSRTRRAA